MSEQEKWIDHCSHSQHNLKEVNSNSTFECHVCKHQGEEGTRFKCHLCNVSIHTICGSLPEYLPSFTHPQHSLTLCPKPFLIHKCRLCGGTVTSMVYRCDVKGCKFFLHPKCSLFPEFLENHPKHPTHTLSLRSLDNSKKLCQVCEKKCKLWRYHCEVCDVHIHAQCLVRDSGNGSKAWNQRIFGS